MDAATGARTPCRRLKTGDTKVAIDLRPRADDAVLARHLDLIALLSGPFGPALKTSRPLVIPASTETTNAEFVIELEVAGVDKARDVTLRLEGGMVVIDVEKQPSRGKPARGDRQYGSWTRAFKPPSRIDLGAATRDYDKGVLRITVPRK